MTKLVDRLQDQLIVSCQVVDRNGFPYENNPMKGPEVMSMLAQAAVLGGAGGIRADAPDNLAAISSEVDVPLIGIYKKDLEGFPVRITPTFECAREVAESGADIIALDATDRPRPNDLSPSEIINRVKRELGVPVMADVSTVEEGARAEEAGADLVATTLAGYTSYTEKTPTADLALVGALAERLQVPVIAEGRISSPSEGKEAFDAGAFAIVVGAKVVNPQRITEEFVGETQSA